MPHAFLLGALAGYAIAIPVGAIAVLIIEHAMRRGFRIGAAAGAGAATADFVYASLAASGGAALADLIAPIETPLRMLAVVALGVIGLRGLRQALRAHRDGAVRVPSSNGAWAVYLRFTGLTLLNPATVIYFAALILALPDIGRGFETRAAFVAGAALSSLSWQLVIAAIGAVAHHRLPARAQTLLGIVGNLVILGFAVALALPSG